VVQLPTIIRLQLVRRGESRAIRIQFVVSWSKNLTRNQPIVPRPATWFNFHDAITGPATFDPPVMFFTSANVNLHLVTCMQTQPRVNGDIGRRLAVPRFANYSTGLPYHCDDDRVDPAALAVCPSG